MKTELSPTQDDKITGALAQATVVLPMWGLIAAVIIWATQREKSAYIRDQALQALGWQVALIGVWFLGMGCYMASFFGTFASIMAMDAGATAPPPALFIPFMAMAGVFLAMFAFIVIGLFAAVRNLQGQLFTYPVVGNWVRSYANREG